MEQNLVASIYDDIAPVIKKEESVKEEPADAG
jgi:hypothetical protein